MASTLTAPEGSYPQSSLTLPFAELGTASNLPSAPASGNFVPPLTPGSSTSTDQTLGGNGTFTPLGSPALGNASTAPIAPIPLIALPLAWRKEGGITIRPTISTSAIRWTAETSISTGSGVPGMGLGMAGRRRQQQQQQQQQQQTDLADEVESSVGSSTGRDAAKQASASTLPDPVIEAALIAQGIDAPAASVAGGVGGILGMSALATYGFLTTPSAAASTSSAHPLSISLLSSTSSSSSANLSNPLAPYRPSKTLVKPKNNIRQSSSSFVVKSQLHPDLKDILAKQCSEGGEQQNARTTVTQRGRTFYWLADVSLAKDPLARILFSNPPTAHDINQLTRSSTTLDVVIGFPTGDIVWLDLITMKYTRINKGGAVTSSGVTQIRWLPCSRNDGLFVSGHIDGTMLVWDREKEDSEPGRGWSTRPFRDVSTSTSASGDSSSNAMQASLSGSVSSGVFNWDPKRNIVVSRPGMVSPSTSAGSDLLLDTATTNPAANDGSLIGEPAALGLSRSPTMKDSLTLSPTTEEAPQSTTSSGIGAGLLGMSRGSQRHRDSVSAGNAPGGEEDVAGGLAAAAGGKWDKNPVTHWRVARTKISDFAISPDLGCIAVASDDGLLRIIDLETEKLLSSHSSYFGSFGSLAWSPDGRFLLAASTDDLLSIYHPRSTPSAPSPPRLLGRCVGHTSWVSKCAFDPYKWKETDRMYRVGSVGEDGKICLWDFSGKSLGRGKVGGPAHPSDATEDHLDRDDVHHPAPLRAAVPTVNPVASLQAWASTSTTGSIVTTSGPMPSLVDIRFGQRGISVLYDNGLMQSFDRPTARILRIGADEAGAASGTTKGGKNASGGGSSKKPISRLGGTISRGMRWMGGGNETQAASNPLQQSRGQQGQPTDIGLSAFVG